MEWETGEATFEPLSVIAADDPVTCAANMTCLLWKNGIGSGTLPKEIKSLLGQSNKEKFRQVRRSQTYMFGYLISRNYMEAMQFDKENRHSSIQKVG